MLRGLLRLSAQPTMIAHFFNFVRMTVWEASVQKKSQIARPAPIPWNASAIFALLEFARRRLLLSRRHRRRATLMLIVALVCVVFLVFVKHNYAAKLMVVIFPVLPVFLLWIIP